eukprot:scaffold2742_cov130-Isochrysis_galbana.AAC.4
MRETDTGDTQPVGDCWRPCPSAAASPGPRIHTAPGSRRIGTQAHTSRNRAPNLARKGRRHELFVIATGASASGPRGWALAAPAAACRLPHIYTRTHAVALASRHTLCVRAARSLALAAPARLSSSERPACWTAVVRRYGPVMMARPCC